MTLKNRIELAKYFASLGFTKGAEIGVSEGKNAETLLRNIPLLELLCVDIWESDRRYEEAKLRLIRCPNITRFYRMKSMEAVRMIKDESLDFVFIDGDHRFDYVMEDLIAWGRKVKRGGIISGHDYYHFRESGVIEAVNTYVEEHKYDLMLTGTDEQSPDDKKPSFFFFKK